MGELYKCQDVTSNVRTRSGSTRLLLHSTNFRLPDSNAPVPGDDDFRYFGIDQESADNSERIDYLHISLFRNNVNPVVRCPGCGMSFWLLNEDHDAYDGDSECITNLPALHEIPKYTVCVLCHVFIDWRKNLPKKGNLSAGTVTLQECMSKSLARPRH